LFIINWQNAIKH